MRYTICKILFDCEFALHYLPFSVLLHLGTLSLLHHLSFNRVERAPYLFVICPSPARVFPSLRSSTLSLCSFSHSILAQNLSTRSIPPLSPIPSVRPSVCPLNSINSSKHGKKEKGGQYKRSAGNVMQKREEEGKGKKKLCIPSTLFSPLTGLLSTLSQPPAQS